MRPATALVAAASAGDPRRLRAPLAVVLVQLLAAADVHAALARLARHLLGVSMLDHGVAVADDEEAAGRCMPLGVAGRRPACEPERAGP